MTKQINDIREFQEKLAEKQEGWLSEKALKRNPHGAAAGLDLRNRLLREEVDELAEAIAEKNEVEVLKEAVDVLYILLGTVHEVGLLDKFEKAWDLVHGNNMTKLDKDGKVHKNKSGKVIKPQNYKPVSLSELFD